jgi:N-dimethylarginine dimethylaminohydrolase
MFLSKNKVFSASDIAFNIKEIEPRQEPGKVLMCTPDYFDIIDIKNPHMKGNEGKLKKDLAQKQWRDLKMIYKNLVEKNVLQDFLEIKGAPSCEDMVFAANQSFPWLTKEGEKIVIMSKMRHPSRQKEVAFFEDFYKSLGYIIIHLKKTDMFEGMGDAIPHYGRKLIYGGYGHRTNKDAYQEISEVLSVPVVLLELKDEKFYHLDTCFLPLDEETVMLYPKAFKKADLEGIYKLFKNVIPVSESEASQNFALNAHIINDQISKKKEAVIQKGSTKVNNELRALGFHINEVDTSEYIRSGGSVFCMKMMVY